MSVAIRGVKNALRNKIRTAAVCLVLAVAIGLTLSMLIANRAVDAKLTALRDDMDTTITANPAFEPKPGQQDDKSSEEDSAEDESTLLTEEQLEAVRDLDHVDSVSATLTGMLETPTDESEESGGKGPITRMGGPGGVTGETDLESPIDADDVGAPEGAKFPVPLNGVTNNVDADGKPFTLTDGEQLSDGDTRGALVSDKVAEKNGLDVGDTFTAFDEEFTVVGIAKTGEYDSIGVTMLAATVQELSEEDGYSGFTIEVDDAENLEAVTEAIGEELGSTVEVRSSSDSAMQAVSGLESVKQISWIGFLVSLMCAAVIVFFTLTMTVRERRKEVGVLKAIGGTNRGVIGQFVTEAVTLVVLGTVLGLGVAAASSNVISDVLVSSNTPSEAESDKLTNGGPGIVKAGPGGPESSQSAADLIGDVAAGIGWDTLGLGLLVALGIAILGSAVPAYLIARVRPAEVLRGE
ncbi:ABC transporter permease [Stackebrandtia nassauensis]|uniref:ABC3 transporter permease protein domain-containing protein n=1 Tax=Stackebrandtia nassauensis (strain DSM 44728 / CIP 108903 / NRRL B-16338 / NBRC 102104 / LLR-40K-21) TaxID=446470 RepID=D3Q0Q4_STANL|nr:ABC transporter permease [Stackebrandtia nassauensis]ADD41790.1 protein of unknown function DUF214 [Stackebrandtia nassauensis DSM 44728]